MTEALDIARRRFTAKVYDPAKSVTDAEWKDLLEILRLAPTSVNYQPVQYFVAETEEERAANTKTDVPPVTEETPAFRDIHISNVYCKGSGRAMFFNGLPEMPIRNVTVKNVVITEAAEGAVISQAEDVQLENIRIETKKKGGHTLQMKNAKKIKVDGKTYKEADAKGTNLNFK